MLKKTIILVLLISSCSTSLFAGGGWTQEQGKGYVKLNQWWINSGKFYNKEAKIIDITTTSVYISSLYVEYGFTDRLTAFVYAPFFVRSTLNKRVDARGNTLAEGDQFNSFGDIDLAIKYGFFQNKAIVLSVGLQIGLPSGDAAGGRTQLLQSGDGEFNQMLLIEASHSFYPFPAYLTVSTAFNNRTNNFSDEWRYGIEAGYNFKKLTAIARLNGIKSLFNGDDTKISGNGLFNNNVEFLAYSAELVYTHSDQFGLTMGAASALQGRQILASSTFSVGIFMKF